MGDKYHILKDKSKADFEGMLEDFINLQNYKPLWETFRHTVLQENGNEVDNIYSIVLEKDEETKKEEKSFGLLGKKK